MSTATETLSNLEALDQQLNQQILAGDILNAFDHFYAEDVVMQENSDAPTVGKAANREHEVQFIQSIEQFHGASVINSAVNAHQNVSLSEWEFDATYKGGFRAKRSQVAVRRWKDGQVVHERFYYKA